MTHFSKSLVIPEIKECSIPLPRVPMRKMCRDNHISYRLVVSDYDIQVSEPEDSSGNDSDNSQNTSFTLNSINGFGDFLSSKTPQRSKKKKKYSESQSTVTSKSKKRHNSRELASNKRLKTGGSILERSLTTSPFTPPPPPPNSVFQSVIKPTMINGTPHLKVQMNGSFTPNTNKKSSIDKTSNSTNSKPKNSKPKWRPPPTRPKRADDNRIFEFLGDRFLACDLLDNECDCENNCELDELSMAFHFLMTTSTEDLPKDLKISVIGRSADQLSSEETDKSDQNLDEVLPGVDDIYQQTIEEGTSFQSNNCFDDYINDFVLNTTVYPTKG